MNEIIKEFEKETIKKISKKYNLKEEEALNYIRREEKNMENKKSRGRPRKEDKVEKKEKGVRGRPPQEEKQRTSHVGEDLIERLINEAKKNYPKQ